MWLFVVVLGIVQGLTEFLPISSSGHLVLVQQLWPRAPLSPQAQLLFDAAVHVATLLVVLWVFRERVGWLVRVLLSYVLPVEIAGEERALGLRLWGLLGIGTLPTVALGLALRSPIEQDFSSTRAVGAALLATGALLFIAGRRAGSRGLAEMRFYDALLIGTMQGLAIFPGISRSGFTIATGLLLGLSRELAAEFSFLLSAPAILGAFLLEIHGLRDVSTATGARIGATLGPLLLGSLLALITGVLALRWLLRLLRHGHLRVFAYYCWPLGLAALAL